MKVTESAVTRPAQYAPHSPTMVLVIHMLVVRSRKWGLTYHANTNAYHHAQIVETQLEFNSQVIARLAAPHSVRGAIAMRTSRSPRPIFRRSATHSVAAKTQPLRSYGAVYVFARCRSSTIRASIETRGAHSTAPECLAMRMLAPGRHGSIPIRHLRYRLPQWPEAPTGNPCAHSGRVSMI